MAGRKVYRNKVSARRKNRKAALIVLVVIIILAAVVFIGYSIANPILDFIEDRKLGSHDTTEPWTPPVYKDETDKITDETTEKSGKNQDDDKKPNNTPSTLQFSAYELPVTALENSETLKNALIDAKNDGYTAVVVTLKAKGGAIYYKTQNAMALSDETAVKGTMSLEQIASMVVASGLKPIASLNLLEDNNRYGANRDGAYHFQSDNSTWLDNSVANGGKPWLSPFDVKTQNYIAALSTEISMAGFETVICDGLTFPAFRNSDLSYIGSIVQNANRYEALFNVVNIVKSSVKPDTNLIVKTSAADIINNTCEVFKPDLLSDCTVLVYYSPADFSKTVVINNQEIVLADLTAFDRTNVIFTEIAKKAGDNINIIPMVNNDSLNQSDFSDTLTCLLELGYDAYVIK